MDKKEVKTIEKDGLILSENGKIVIGVTDYDITNVVIPEGVEEVGDRAFNNCHLINKITFPGTLKKIGFASFTCIHTGSLFIPEGVEIIEEAAFFNSHFSYVSLPSTLKVLEEAFLGCAIWGLCIKVRDLKSLKLYGEKNWYTGEGRLPWGNFAHYKLYVPSHLVDAYKEHPVFGKFKHVEDIANANNDYLVNWKRTRYCLQDTEDDYEDDEEDGYQESFKAERWWMPFIKVDDGWYIDSPIRLISGDELKITRGLDTLCEAFSYDGEHAEMEIFISDELDEVDNEPGYLAKCRKASASSGAEYYVNLDCMKEHQGLFWVAPDVLFAIEKFPQYMKIMPRKLDNSQMEALGIKKSL